MILNFGLENGKSVHRTQVARYRRERRQRDEKEVSRNSRNLIAWEWLSLSFGLLPPRCSLTLALRAQLLSPFNIQHSTFNIQNLFSLASR